MRYACMEPVDRVGRGLYVLRMLEIFPGGREEGVEGGGSLVVVAVSVARLEQIPAIYFRKPVLCQCGYPL